METTVDQRQPQGFILIISLFILVLLGLMGFALLANTRTEISITGATAQGRQAFTRADATARLAVLLARPLFQTGAGIPSDYIVNEAVGDRPPFEVSLNNFALSADLDKVGGSLTDDEILRRYLTATDAAQASASPDLTPQVVLSHDGEVIGSAYVSFYVPQPLTQGESSYSDSGMLLYLIVSADGRLPLGGGSDPGNYYQGTQETKHSIVTTIYRDLLQ